MNADNRRQVQSELLLLLVELGDSDGFPSMGDVLLLETSFDVGFGRNSSVEFFRMPRLTDLSTKMGWIPDRSPMVL
jgi:hypothetical protein